MKIFIKNFPLTFFFNSLLMFALFLGGYLKYQNTLPIPYWELIPTTTTQYFPSNQNFGSLTDNKILASHLRNNSLQTMKERSFILGQYFSQPSFKQYVSYEISGNYQIESKNKAQKDKLYEILREVWFQTNQNDFPLKPHAELIAMARNVEQLLLGRLGINMIKKLFKELESKKVSPGIVRLNFIISPKINKEFHYDNEYAGENFITWDNGQNKVPHSSFLTNIYESKLPYDGRTYQFKGGAITFEFKILEDQVIGETTYYRYLMAHYKKLRGKIINDKDFEVIRTSLNEGEDHNQLITVKQSESYTAKSQMPQFTKFDIYFGDFILPLKFTKEASRTVSSLNQKGIYFDGQVLYNDRKYLFKTKLEDLAFNYQKGEFSDQTKMKIELLTPNIPLEDIGPIQLKIKKKILRDNGFTLLKELELDEISTFIKISDIKYEL